MEIIRIKNDKNERKPRVAAYARVSSQDEGQKSSYDNQVEYFEAYIKSNPNWEFAGVYADYGKSGVSADKRPDFLRMIEDAKAGKIDIILTKSISRFARNSLEAQQFAHILKEYGVEVRFQREDLSSLDPHSEMVFNFLTAVAEEQSRSISENTVWALEKLAEQGIRHIGNNRVLGYDEIDGVLVPNEQAWIPELIYALYAADKPMREIIKTLKEKNAKRLRSDTPFDQRTIEQILENEIYVGDRQIQKGPHRDFKTGKPKVHEDYVSYFVTDGHEGIVSREVWDKAQERLKMERERKDKKIYRKHNSHFLYGRLMCGECGEWMTRKSNIGRKGQPVKNWYCRDRVKGKRGNGCKNLIIPEEEILQALAEFLGHEWTGIENVDESIYENIKVARVFADGTISVDLIN